MASFDFGWILNSGFDRDSGSRVRNKLQKAMSTTHRGRPQVLSTGAASTVQRPVIALDAWESAISLQEDQIESVNVWKSHCEQKPLPLKVRGSIQFICFLN